MKVIATHADGAPSMVEIAGIIFVRLNDEASPHAVGIANGDEPKTLRAKDSSQ